LTNFQTQYCDRPQLQFMIHTPIPDLFISAKERGEKPHIFQRMEKNATCPYDHCKYHRQIHRETKQPGNKANRKKQFSQQEKEDPHTDMCRKGRIPLDEKMPSSSPDADCVQGVITGVRREEVLLFWKNTNLCKKEKEKVI